MADDPMARRFDKKNKTKALDGHDNRTRSVEDIEAEEELLKNTDKVEPLKADAQPGRNDPCPCGSGKKYKKCCGA